MRKFSSVARFIVVASAACLSTLCSAEQVVSVGPQGRLIDSSYFGMHLRSQTKSRWPFVKFGSLRLIADDTHWLRVEPSRGKWNFQVLDIAVQNAVDNGVVILHTIGQTPTWAASRPNEMVRLGGGAASEPANIEDWKNYVRQLARRYKGRIKYYELWNEPYFREVDPYKVQDGFTGYASKMVEMGRVAKGVLAEEDPQAVLISPGLSAGYQGLDRVEQWFKSGGGEVAPILAYHFYLRPPERIAGLQQRLRAITRKYGYPDMPIWNTESGYLVENSERPQVSKWPDSDYVFGKVLTPAENAANMVRAHLIAAAAGVERFYWFAWDIPDMGLTQSFGTVPTEGAAAYSTMLRWLRMAVVKDCVTRDDNLWVCRLSRAGSNALVVWSVKGKAPFDLPAGESIGELESLDGGVRPVTSSRVDVSDAPVLLREKGRPWLLAN